MNGRENEATGAARYTERGSTNFAALPGRRRNEKYAAWPNEPPVPWEGTANVTQYELWRGDCRACMANMGDESVDSVVCDPPYHLTSTVKRFGGENAAPAQFGTDGAYQRASRGFMGKTWDGGGVAFDPSLWAEVWRVLKPGGHVVAFGGSRTYHRLAVAIEDAGFEIRDGLIWLYGSGFPKSLDISKAIDKAAGARGNSGSGFNAAGRGERSNGGDVLRSDHPDYVRPVAVTPEAQQWDGWGTALKPAHEPIVLGRKPLIGTVAANVLAHGVGGLNIDGCRVGDGERVAKSGGMARKSAPVFGQYGGLEETRGSTDTGRFPANVMHDGSDPVLAIFPGQAGGGFGVRGGRENGAHDYGLKATRETVGFGDSGSAARFFYCAKASKADRDEGLEELPLGRGGTEQYDSRWKEGTGEARQPNGRANTHPTVKPTNLMRWLVRLVTPPGGLVFDPFTGSGSTGKAAVLEGFRFLGAELTPEYWPIATARLDHAVNERHKRASEEPAI